MTEDPFVAHRSLLFTVAYEMLRHSISIVAAEPLGLFSGENLV